MTVKYLGVRLRAGRMEQPVVACLFDDNTVVLAGSEGMLQRVVDEFDRVCKRIKVKVSVGKSKVMVPQRAKDEIISFAKHYQISKECKIWLGEEQREEVSKFEYLGTVLFINETMERGMREREQ